MCTHCLPYRTTAAAYSWGPCRPGFPDASHSASRLTRPPAGQLGEELRKTQQQLQAARDDNVTLFEKARGVSRLGVPGYGRKCYTFLAFLSYTKEHEPCCLHCTIAQLTISSNCRIITYTHPLQVRYLERYSQKAAASAGRTTVVRVDAAGVAQPADGAGAGARGSRYQCGPFALEVGGGRAGGGGAAGGAGGGGQLPANVVTTGAGGMRSRGGRKGAANQVMACFGVGWVVGCGALGAEVVMGPPAVNGRQRCAFVCRGLVTGRCTGRGQGAEVMSRTANAAGSWPSTLGFACVHIAIVLVEFPLSQA